MELLPLVLMLAALQASPPAGRPPSVDLAHAVGQAPPRLDRHARCCRRGRIEGSAPLILQDLARHWSEAFARAQTNVAVAIPPPYEPPQGALSSRFRAFLTGRLDFAFLTRALSSKDRQHFRRTHGFDPVVVPVANGSWRTFGHVDPIVIIVNETNPIRGLSFEQLDAIFSATRRRGHSQALSWGNLGVGSWDHRPVHVIGGASWSGEDSARGQVIREKVMLGGSWLSLPMESGTEADVPARVAIDPLAIGFTGLGHMLPGTRPVALRIRRDGGFVAPTLKAVASGRYPLARTVDLLIARHPRTCLKPELRAFIDFLVSREGQSIVRERSVFLPLRAEQAEEARRLARRCD